jgi:hypothetical protein
MNSVTPPHRLRRPEVILYPKNLCCQSKTPLPSQQQGLLVALSTVVRTALTSPLAQGPRTAKNDEILRLKATVEKHRLRLSERQSAQSDRADCRFGTCYGVFP